MFTLISTQKKAEKQIYSIRMVRHLERELENVQLPQITFFKISTFSTIFLTLCFLMWKILNLNILFFLLHFFFLFYHMALEEFSGFISLFNQPPSILNCLLTLLSIANGCWATKIIYDVLTSSLTLWCSTEFFFLECQKSQSLIYNSAALVHFWQ